jgi:membrane glycosyltransferase
MAQLQRPPVLLWGATVALLILPRLLGVLLVLREGLQRLYGGAPALVASALLEALLSALLAPVRMAAHTLFVLTALTGVSLQWRSPPREATKLRWRDAAPALLPLSALAALAFAGALAADASVALWLSPVVLPLLLAWPIAVWSGRPAQGRWLRRIGLLLTPEEMAPAAALRQAWAGAGSVATTSPGALEPLHQAASCRRAA